MIKLTQAVKDVINIAPRLREKTIVSIKVIMEEALDKMILEIEPDTLLENMDVTEKLMYLDYISKSEDERKKMEDEAIPFENILKEEDLTYDDLQD